MIIGLCWPSGNCWVPVRDEFNSRFELKFKLCHLAQISDKQLPVRAGLAMQDNGLEMKRRKIV
jgi:hypothetical protein